MTTMRISVRLDVAAFVALRRLEAAARLIVEKFLPDFEISRRRTLMFVSGRLLRVPEVANRLAIRSTEVYLLTTEGALDAGKRDGVVHVPEKAVRDYERRRPPRSPRAKSSPPPLNRPSEDREWLLSVPEVARRLRMDGTEVFSLILTRRLDARRGRDGRVYVPEQALRDFEERRKTGT